MDGIPVFHNQMFWEHIRQQPLARMLLLSLSLHAAVVMLVQPSSISAPRQTVVINAQLVPAATVSPSTLAPIPVQTTIQPEPILPERVPLTFSKQLTVPPISAANSSVQPTPINVSKPAAETPVSKETLARPANNTTASLPSVPVMIDTNWYEARQLDVQPRASQPINPAYPSDAQRRGQQGTVKLKLKVDEFGAVRDVEVEGGNPPGVFDDSALAAFKNAHFEPARKEGQPVRALIYIRVRYELGDF